MRSKAHCGPIAGLPLQQDLLLGQDTLLLNLHSAAFGLLALAAWNDDHCIWSTCADDGAQHDQLLCSMLSHDPVTHP